MALAMGLRSGGGWWTGGLVDWWTGGLAGFGVRWWPATKDDRYGQCSVLTPDW